ncbi:L-aspartate oxidase [Nakamurella sp. GG22]
MTPLSAAAGALLPSWEAEADVVVVGTGVAGLTAALTTAAEGLYVLLITKGQPDEASTQWAQGGVAVVRDERDPGDSVTHHIEDTLVAGAGLADPIAVDLILTDGPDAVQRLMDHGARFDAGPDGLLRTREGGHSANRVIHAGGDATGAEIERALLAVRGLPSVLAGHQALDVVLDGSGRARGLSVLAPDGTVGLIRSDAVVLATGGAGHLYAATTNPGVATGDGLAMALRAGAALADTEFFQFHPTVLWTGPGDLGHRPLITEAVRGEGAVLIDGAGARIMPGVHPLADLAPRDVVSLAISRRMGLAPGGIGDHVYLDATGIAGDVFARRFPTVSAACALAGVDPSTQPIPVAPAAHYHCGGILTDLDGRSTVPGLFAVGEVARTGLHGANRLASNSLLEGLVMGERAAAAIGADVLLARSRPAELILTPVPGADPAGRTELQATMSRAAGIGRDLVGLLAARSTATRLGAAPTTVADRWSVETANLALAGAALLAAAEVRAESRGCHVRNDHPDSLPVWERSVLVRAVDGLISTDVADLRTAVAWA